MSKVTLALLVVLSVLQIQARQFQPDWKAYGTAVQPARPDPVIQNALREISMERIRHTIEKLVGFGNRNTLGGAEGDGREGSTSAESGIGAAADWIERELKSYSAACGGCLEVKRDTWTEQPQSRIPKPTRITNVYAILRGSDEAQAKRMHLVTGHYDSRNTDVLDARGLAPGANDDASGVAVSLECARVLSKRKWPSTLVFVAVAGEEQGLNGSRHLAHLAKEEGWQLEGVLNDDIAGGNTTPGDRLQDKSAVRVFSEGIPARSTPEQVKHIVNLGAESDSPSRELARAVADIARTYTPVAKTGKSGLNAILEFRRDRYLRGGDHTSFNTEGFPAVRFTEWREDFHHQHQDLRSEGGLEYGDLLKFVDFGYVAKVARLNAAVLAVTASAPGTPRNVRLVTATLDNSSTLVWDSPEGAPAGIRYEVVWRETAAPDWQFTVEVDGNKVTLPVSKDNVIFGVRSIDGGEHRSPAAIPQ
ncbi:MAG: M28 family metallopeptidase [Acidobacteriota bacterium]|nr:M28 family metallopeptidase [Acidobacteriota bacterium]